MTADLSESRLPHNASDPQLKVCESCHRELPVSHFFMRADGAIKDVCGLCTNLLTFMNSAAAFGQSVQKVGFSMKQLYDEFERLTKVLGKEE